MHYERPLILVGALILALVLAFTLRTDPVSPQTPFGGTQQTTVSSGDPEQAVELTADLLAQHNDASSCWTVIGGKVYDITGYVSFHPGGRADILRTCGIDGTALFTGSAPGGRSHSKIAQNLLEQYYLGDLGATAQAVPVIDETFQPLTLEEAIEADYPGAVLSKVHHEDDGGVEGTFVWEGQRYEFDADGLGNLLEVERT